MNHNSGIHFVLAAILVALNARAGELERSFAVPPEGTRPRCYWYWMDGHITREGITKDLDAMKCVGIGEAYIGIISGQSGMPANPGPKALTEAWWDNIEHAVREGGRLGVDIGLFNSPGWSQSGGPWVKPEQAMRYVVLPETRLRGPQRFEGKLPAPTGKFQDVAVLAFPAPAGEDELAKITTRTPTRVQFEMATPFTTRSVSVQPVAAVNVSAELQASDDGQHYRTVKKFTINRHNLKIQVGPVPLASVVASFPATTARYFRLEFSAGCELGDIRLSPAARVESIAEKSLLKVFQEPLPPFDFYTWPLQAESESAGLTVTPAAVRDLTKLLAADGTPRWDVPSGEWIVLRAAMTPTGTQNAPAPVEATGLEVDKMNRAALKAHFDAYVGYLLKRMPADERKALKHVVADSYEMGPENWTDGFAGDFRQRYGYDPLPWLPVLTGRIVGSADQSDRFLWDLRRLVADRIARDYAGGLRDLCHEHGLKMWLENYGHWGFPAEFLQYGGACDEVDGEFWVGAPGPEDGVELRDAASAAHIYGKPAVWAEAFTGGPSFKTAPGALKVLGDWAFCEGINQFVLHVYIHQPWEDKQPGINAWFGTEFNRHNTWFGQGKAWIDYLRRCSVMLQAGQPVADVAYFISEDTPKMAGCRKPELPPGRDYDYINAEVIQKDLGVRNGLLTLPHGVSWRVLVLPESATMRPELLHRIRDLIKAGGTVVGTPPSRSPSLENFPKCDEEVRQLAREVWGERAAGPSGEHKLGKGRIVWGKGLDEVLAALGSQPDFESPAKLRFKHRRQGATEIYFVANSAAAFVTTAAAFRVDGKVPELWWPDSGRIERPAVFEVADGVVRLPLSLGPRGSVFVVFREQAATAEPQLVSITQAGAEVLGTKMNVPSAGNALIPPRVTRNAAGRIEVQATQSGDYQLRFDNGNTQTLTISAVLAPVEITGPWEVRFAPGWGAPEKVAFDSLTDWTKRAEDSIKYFSGQATYRKTFELSPEQVGTGSSNITLDLGDVRDLATVRVNGRELATLWLAPWQVDITAAVKPGGNTLEIVVVNTWNNRLAADAARPAAGRRTFLSTWKMKRSGALVERGAALLPAGLLGPVTLRTSQMIELR